MTSNNVHLKSFIRTDDFTECINIISVCEARFDDSRNEQMIALKNECKLEVPRVILLWLSPYIEFYMHIYEGVHIEYLCAKCRQ